jgi:hypothetical protein
MLLHLTSLCIFFVEVKAFKHLPDANCLCYFPLNVPVDLNAQTFQHAIIVSDGNV